MYLVLFFRLLVKTRRIQILRIICRFTSKNFSKLHLLKIFSHLFCSYMSVTKVFYSPFKLLCKDKSFIHLRRTIVFLGDLFFPIHINCFNFSSVMFWLCIVKGSFRYERDSDLWFSLNRTWKYIFGESLSYLLIKWCKDVFCITTVRILKIGCQEVTFDS